MRITDGAARREEQSWKGRWPTGVPANMDSVLLPRLADFVPCWQPHCKHLLPSLGAYVCVVCHCCSGRWVMRVLSLAWMLVANSVAPLAIVAHAGIPHTQLLEVCSKKWLLHWPTRAMNCTKRWLTLSRRPRWWQPTPTVQPTCGLWSTIAYCCLQRCVVLLSCVRRCCCARK